MVRMCAGVIPALNTPSLEKEAKEFFTAHKVKEGDMAISQALESLHINVFNARTRNKTIGGVFILTKIKEVTQTEGPGHQN